MAFFLLQLRSKNFPMKTVIYVLAGAIALSSVGCTAGRKERQAKAEPPSGSKAVAKTKTSARAALSASAKPSDTKKPVGKDLVVSKPAVSASKTAQPVAKKDVKVDSRGSGTKASAAKVSAKPTQKVEPKSAARSSSGNESGSLSFNASAVEAVAPLPKPTAPVNRVVVPPKLVRVGASTEKPKPEPSSTPEKQETPAKSEAPKPATVAKAAPKASKEKVQAELNQALADAGSDARAVVGSLVPTAIPDSAKAPEKSPVVEDDAPSTSDTSAVVKSPATMKSSDAGAPPAVVDSKGEVKEATAPASVASAATSSKAGEPAAEAKPGSPEATVPTPPPAPVPPVEAATSATPSAPKKPTSPLEKKEMIASALRDGNEALKSEDSVKALELFESVVKQDKDQRDAWFRIGYLKEMSGDIQGAIKAFREVKRILAN